MTKYTPTPWQISPVRTTEDTAMIVGGEGFEFGLIADVTEDYDATFIVKAVNNHDALVKALETIAAMDPKGIRADDLGRAARIASEAINGAVGSPTERGK